MTSSKSFYKRFKRLFSGPKPQAQQQQRFDSILEDKPDGLRPTSRDTKEDGQGEDIGVAAEGQQALAVDVETETAQPATPTRPNPVEPREEPETPRTDRDGRDSLLSPQPPDTSRFSTPHKDISRCLSPERQPDGSPGTFPFFTPRLSPRREHASDIDSPGASPTKLPARTPPPDGRNMSQPGLRSGEASGQPQAALSPDPRTGSHDWTISSLYSSAAGEAQSDPGGTRKELRVIQLAEGLPASMARPKWFLQDFRILTMASTRNKLKVYRARCVQSGIQVDLKAHHKNRITPAQLAALKRNVKVLARLSHPSIVKFYGAFEDCSNIYFLMERSYQADIAATGSQADIDSIKALSERQAVSEWLRPILDSFNYLKAELKAEGISVGLPCLLNLSFTDSSVVKYRAFISAWDERTREMCEADWWAALVPPERCGRLPPGITQEDYSEERLMSWAMGTLCFRLISGHLPSINACPTAPGHPGDALYDAEAQKKLFSAFSADACSFLHAALCLNPAERKPVEELRAHPFMTMASQAEPGPSNIVDTPAPPAQASDRYSDEIASVSGSSFAVPRGPSMESCHSQRCSLADRKSLSYFDATRWTTEPASTGKAGTAPPSNSPGCGWILAAGTSSRITSRTNIPEDQPVSGPTRTVTSAFEASLQPMMEGAGLFLPSKGSTPRKTQPGSSPHWLSSGEEGSRTSQSSIRNKMRESLQSQEFPAIPASVSKLLQQRPVCMMD